MLLISYLKLQGKVPLRGFGVRCHQYTDDTQLSLFPPASKVAVGVLSGRGWGLHEGNSPILNSDKTEVLLVWETAIRSSACSGWGSTPSVKEQLCSLGALLDPNLSLDCQVASVGRGPLPNFG